MSSNAVTVKVWNQFTRDEVFEMAKLRSDVFFLEQRITEEELDRFDRQPTTRHYWTEDRDGFAAYLRVVSSEPKSAAQSTPSLSVGRVVVRPDRRGEGLAQVLMQRVIADSGREPLMLHSQVYVADLYRKFGFREVGDSFDEAGIPHIGMVRPASGD